MPVAEHPASKKGPSRRKSPYPSWTGQNQIVHCLILKLKAQNSNKFQIFKTSNSKWFGYFENCIFVIYLLFDHCILKFPAND